MKKLQTGCPIFFSLAVPLFHLFRNILKESCCHCAASSYLPLCLQLPFSTIAISISFIFLLIYLFNCHIYFLSYFCSIAIYIYLFYFLAASSFLPLCLRLLSTIAMEERKISDESSETTSLMFIY